MTNFSTRKMDEKFVLNWPIFNKTSSTYFYMKTLIDYDYNMKFFKHIDIYYHSIFLGSAKIILFHFANLFRKKLLNVENLIKETKFESTISSTK